MCFKRSVMFLSVTMAVQAGTDLTNTERHALPLPS